MLEKFSTLLNSILNSLLYWLLIHVNIHFIVSISDVSFLNFLEIIILNELIANIFNIIIHCCNNRFLISHNFWLLSNISLSLFALRSNIFKLFTEVLEFIFKDCSAFIKAIFNHFFWLISCFFFNISKINKVWSFKTLNFSFKFSYLNFEWTLCFFHL